MKKFFLIDQCEDHLLHNRYVRMDRVINEGKIDHLNLIDDHRQDNQVSIQLNS